MKQESSINKLLYNPSCIPQAEFLSGFIVRHAEFQRIWEDMLDSRLDAIDPHFLITGQRGMGKTSLMLKVAYEIRRESRLSDWLLPVLLPEEMFGVYDLLNFWVAVANALETQYPGKFKGLADEAGNLAMKNEESLVMEAIVNRLRKPPQKLVLFIDNFGDLLDKFPEKEIHRLREICSTAKWLRVVAASARVLDHTYSYDRPFFDFFHPIPLRGLSKNEARRLLEGIAELEPEHKRDEILETLRNRPERLETVRRLSGGAPRMLALLYSFVSKDPESSSLTDLEGLLDQVTAYYKHRVEELPKQQQTLLHHVAMVWDAVGVGEIAENARMESKAVSANLRHLVENNILEKVETGGKNHLYRMQERLFNIWYLMRISRIGKDERTRWVLDFLKVWLDRDGVRKNVTMEAEANYKPIRNFGHQLMAAEDRAPEYNFQRMNENPFEAAPNPLAHCIELLWGSDFFKAQQESAAYFSKKPAEGPDFRYQAAYLLTLLILHQNQECQNLFENSIHRLKDAFKPIWYALQKLRGEDGRKESLRMGPELAETVDEIVEWVLAMRTKYPG